MDKKLLMGYIFLLLTILAESAAIIFMKLSDGFHNKLQVVFAIICYLMTFIFLTLALKNLSVGLTNAIWAGSSTILVAVLGIFIFKEHLTPLQLVFLALIVVGLIGLNFSSRT